MEISARMRCQSKDGNQQYQKNQKGHAEGRSLRFAQEEIMNYSSENTFIQMETGPDVIQYKVGRQEASAAALACACNKFTDKEKVEKNC